MQPANGHWCSPRFAVQVSKWVRELMTTGRVELNPGAASQQYVTTDQLSGIIQAQTDMFRQMFQTLRELRAPAHPGPQNTVRMRLEKRYPGWKTTPTQRATIRKIANNLIKRLLGQQVHYDGDECVYFDHHLALLDDAIDVVKRKADRDGTADGWGLFS